MRNLDERMGAVKQRAVQLEREKRKRRIRVLKVGMVAACLAMVVGLGFFMPWFLPEHVSGVRYDSGMVAGIFEENKSLGYIVVGVLAFVLGICVTVVCYKVRFLEEEQKNSEERQDSKHD